jgi:electron transport complex protein RnfG
MALTYYLAKDDIAARALDDQLDSLSAVMPQGLYDNDLVQDAIVMQNAHGKNITVYRAFKNNQLTGAAFETSSIGYAGEIKLMLGVDANGKILGTRVVAHKETPGLGDKIEVRKGDWILGFTGLGFGNPPVEKWKVKKDGGQFDQFTGATITPRAVLKAIREGLEFFDAHKAQMEVH